jgi:hypothetical protein
MWNDLKVKLYYKFGFKFDYRVWAEDRELKWFAEARTLDDQGQHLALVIPTSKMAHAERERENTPAKQHQSKVWATKAQQDLSINMTINSRHLACKA